MKERRGEESTMRSGTTILLRDLDKQLFSVRNVTAKLAVKLQISFQ